MIPSWNGNFESPIVSDCIREFSRDPWHTLPVRLFFTGPVVKTELLVAMLEKHGIAATQEFVDPAAPDDGDLDRPANVLVPDDDLERARQLFYTEREGEL